MCKKIEAGSVYSLNLNSSFNYWSPDWRQDNLTIIIIILISYIGIFGVTFTS